MQDDDRLDVSFPSTRVTALATENRRWEAWTCRISPAQGVDDYPKTLYEDEDEDEDDAVQSHRDPYPQVGYGPCRPPAEPGGGGGAHYHGPSSIAKSDEQSWDGEGGRQQ
jgi:hypothetical protein